MTRLQNLYCLISIFLFASAGFAQNQSSSDSQWVRIKDDKSEFSILFPQNYLVDNEIEKSYILAPVPASMPDVINLFEKPKIIGHQKSVRMSLSVYQLSRVSSAKNYLWYFVGRDTAKDKYQDFRVGNFVGRKTSFDTEKTLALSIAITTKTKVYLINASAKNEDEKLYEKFVMSLALNGKPLFKSQTTEPADASQTVLISTLRTSPEILEALNQKQEKSEIKVVKSTAAEAEEKVEQNFSRPLILLRQPPPALADAARSSNISGFVRLKVAFLANGKIGNMAVVSEVPNDLTESVIKAARKIKFLPAEIDGKKVDVTRTIEYAFDVR